MFSFVRVGGFWVSGTIDDVDGDGGCDSWETMVGHCSLVIVVCCSRCSSSLVQRKIKEAREKNNIRITRLCKTKRQRGTLQVQCTVQGREYPLRFPPPKFIMQYRPIHTSCYRTTQDTCMAVCRYECAGDGPRSCYPRTASDNRVVHTCGVSHPNVYAGGPSMPTAG
jgi:hypothetical protein